MKNYEKSPLSDKLFSAPKTNNLIRWWTKLKSQAKGGNQEPLLFFKYNRSPIFVVTEIVPKESEYMYISKLTCFVCLAEEWLDKEEVKFINGI